MQSFGESLSEKFNVDAPRVLMQGKHVRALEFLFDVPVCLQRARELSRAADEREVLIDTDCPGRVQLLMNAAPVAAKAIVSPQLRIASDTVAPELVRRLYAVFEGITVYENDSAPHPELHVEGVRKLFVNRTQRAFQEDVEHAEIRKNGTLVLRIAPVSRKRKRSE